MNNPRPWWLTWPPEEVAAAILPLFSQPLLSPYGYQSATIHNIVVWCKTGQWSPRRHASGNPFEDPDWRAIAEALQVLEHARLIMRYDFGGGVSDPNVRTGLTRLGMQTLATNTVRQRLGLGDAPPTA